MSLELWIGIAALVISAALWAVYIAARIKYNPRIEFRVGPEDGDEPIALGEEGDFMFGVTSKSKYKVELSEVWVKFNPHDKVQLSPYKGSRIGEVELTIDKGFPAAIHFTGPFFITEKHIRGFHFDYKAERTSGEFMLKFETNGKVSDSEVSFPFDIFPTKTVRYTRLVSFKTKV